MSTDKLIAAWWQYVTLKPVDVKLTATSGTDMIIGVWDLLNTADLDGDSRAFDQRLSRCYELAVHPLITGAVPRGTYLVHGSIKGKHHGAKRIGHGWLVFDNAITDLVWEPILACWFNREEWYDWADAQDEVVYTVHHARIKISKSGHYGRWHESEHP